MEFRKVKLFNETIFYHGDFKVILRHDQARDGYKIFYKGEPLEGEFYMMSHVECMISQVEFDHDPRITHLVEEFQIH